MTCPSNPPTSASQVVWLVLLAAINSTAWSAETPPSQSQVLTLKGHVVWLAEALQKRHGMQSVPEAAKRILALEAADGGFYPLLEDKRGHAFRVDPRLRQGQVELLVRKHVRSPMSQIIKIFSIDKEGQKFELDYWCEICAIAMFELQICDCCQGDIELRLRKVEPK